MPRRPKRTAKPPKRVWVVFEEDLPQYVVLDPDDLDDLADNEVVYRFDLHDEKGK